MSFIAELFNGREQNAEEVYRRNLDGVLGFVQTGAIENNERLRGLFGIHYAIDEMALLFATEVNAMKFITALVEREGFTLFNSATDTVETAPIRSGYRVRYWFVSTPWDYRLEIMVLGQDGYSPVHEPLHKQIANHYGSQGICAVHASFKVPNEEKYAAAVHQLQKNGYVVLQHCQSSYGRFSYFSQGGTFDSEVNEVWHLKPRINTRDAK